MIDASRRIYAQLTALGWVNIAREIAESGGLDVDLEHKEISSVFFYTEEGSTLNNHELHWEINDSNDVMHTAEAEWDMGMCNDYQRETLVDPAEIACSFPELEEWGEGLESEWKERNFHMLAALPNSRKTA